MKKIIYGLLIILSMILFALSSTAVNINEFAGGDDTTDTWGAIVETVNWEL